MKTKSNTADTGDVGVSAAAGHDRAHRERRRADATVGRFPRDRFAPLPLGDGPGPASPASRPPRRVSSPPIARPHGPAGPVTDGEEFGLEYDFHLAEQAMSQLLGSLGRAADRNEGLSERHLRWVMARLREIAIVCPPDPPERANTGTHFTRAW